VSPDDEWSPDEPLGTETFEQGDEAFDNADELDPNFLEDVEIDPSIDPELEVDDRELEEAGAELDDPESMAVLSGGIDDPDGLGSASPGTRARKSDDDGWDLDSEDEQDDKDSLDEV
jgi:hypothetical protein